MTMTVTMTVMVTMVVSAAMITFSMVCLMSTPVVVPFRGLRDRCKRQGSQQQCDGRGFDGVHFQVSFELHGMALLAFASFGKPKTSHATLNAG